MLRNAFAAAFIFSILFLGIRFANIGMIDDEMWAEQSEYVQTGDSRQFNAAEAYGHPGGPIILGTLAVHSLGFSYQSSLFIFLTVFISLFIAITCTLCFAMIKDSLWWLAVLGVLSLHPLHGQSTPPSATVSVLLACLCILTFYILDAKEKPSRLSLLAWSILAGLSLATRTDISTLAIVSFAVPLFLKFGIKRVAYLCAGAFAVFCIFDPFMWYMPIQHIQDLVSKILFHYNDFTMMHLSFLKVVSFSLLAFISMLFAAVYITRYKKQPNFLSVSLLISLFALTIVAYSIFLTAHYQAIRYFMPVILIWEVLLPLFIFSYIPNIRFSFLPSPERQAIAHKYLKISVLLLLVAYPLLVLIYVLDVFGKY